MNYITESLKNYLFLLFLYSLLEIGILQYYKRKHINVSYGFIIGYQIFICLLICIFTMTGVKGINSMIFQSYKQMNLIIYFDNILSYDCIMNVIMFIPIGLIIPMLWKSARKTYRVMFSGFALSLIIEFNQLFSYRASDINDILTNTIGVLLGYMIYKLFFKKFNYFELSDNNRVKICSFIQILIIYLVYFFIGSPILLLIQGF